MTRTQILLEPWQHKFLSGLAKKRGRSLSGLIRDWVEEKAAALKSERGKDSLLGLAGIVSDRSADVSENVDSYLYGAKNRRRR